MRLRQEFLRGPVNPAERLKYPLHLRHVKCRRHSFAGDIPDQDRQMMLIQHGKIIIISPHFKRGRGESFKVDLVQRWELLRQQLPLHILGKDHFPHEAFALQRLLDEA